MPLKVVVYLQPEILTAPNFLTWNKCSLSPPVPFIGHYTTQNELHPRSLEEEGRHVGLTDY